TSGTALIEFAFVAPVLMALYLGGFELMDAASRWRKVTVATRAIADLTSQYTSVSNSDLDTVLAASQQIMLPYPTTTAGFRVSLVTVDAGGQATVTWSRARNATALTPGTPYNIPTNLKQPGISLVVSDVSYLYTPVAMGTLGNIPLGDQIFMMPRGSATITLKPDA
ncbi:MAG: pilus assembly protein, partial [Sphingomonadaceae bacterium]|nr:pilus assembly protein [Sphingomonadaceae bacterium]